MNKLSPRKFRELVFQALYAMNFHDENSKQVMLENLMNEQLKSSSSQILLGIQKAYKIYSQRNQIDAIIDKIVKNYPAHYIQRIERNILRLSTFEIVFDKALNNTIYISEAIRISKKFASKKSIPFVNAILDEIQKHHPSI